MAALDPQHTNDISYHDFLEVFEEKESMVDIIKPIVGRWLPIYMPISIYG